MNDVADVRKISTNKPINRTIKLKLNNLKISWYVQWEWRSMNYSWQIKCDTIYTICYILWYTWLLFYFLVQTYYYIYYIIYTKTNTYTLHSWQLPATWLRDASVCLGWQNMPWCQVKMQKQNKWGLPWRKLQHLTCCTLAFSQDFCAGTAIVPLIDFDKP